MRKGAGRANPSARALVCACYSLSMSRRVVKHVCVVTMCVYARVCVFSSAFAQTPTRIGHGDGVFAHACLDREGGMHTVGRISVQRLRGGGVHSGARLHLRNAGYIKPGLEAGQDLPPQVMHPLQLSTRRVAGLARGDACCAQDEGVALCCAGAGYGCGPGPYC